jgi:hypothetical protein
MCCMQRLASRQAVPTGAIQYRGWPLAAACSGFSDPSPTQIGSCERRLPGSLCTKLRQALPSKGS